MIKIVVLFCFMLLLSCENSNNIEMNNPEVNLETTKVNNVIIENSISLINYQFIVEFSGGNNNPIINRFYGSSESVLRGIHDISNIIDEFIKVAKKNHYYSQKDHNELLERINNFKKMCLKLAPKSFEGVVFDKNLNEINITELRSKGLLIKKYKMIKSSIYIYGQSTLIELYINMMKYKTNLEENKE